MATEVTLTATDRKDDAHGSAACRRLRRQGRVPAVMYGGGSEARSLAVDAKALRRALSTEAGMNALITLDLDGDSTQLTMAREVSYHPIRDEVAHLDFIVVSREDRVHAEVPLVLTGEAWGVREEGGVLQQQLNTITVEAPVVNVPRSIELDITELALGHSLHATDVTAPAGVDVLNDPETVVVSVVQTSVSKMLEEEEAQAATTGAEAAGEGAAAGPGRESPE